MVTSEEVFIDVLSYIQNSNLNFTLYQTPYSAQLSLKKSFVNHFVKKDTKKSPKVINEHIVNREVENERLRREINHIKAELIKVENDKNCEIDVLKQKCNNLKNAEIKKFWEKHDFVKKRKNSPFLKI